MDCSDDGGNIPVRLALAVALLAAAMAAAGCGCGEDDDDGHPRRVEGIIGPDGGELISGDRLVWLVIPERALAEELTFFIEESDARLPEGALSIPYEIGAVGLDEVELAEPATITIYYDAAQSEGRSRYGVHGATMPAGALEWICISFSAASPTEDAVVITTTQLSTWVPRYLPCEDDGPCHEPEKCVVTDGSPGFCAIPCLDDAECPHPMSCSEDQVCAYSKCYGEAVQCPELTACSVTGERPGICTHICDAGTCGGLEAEQGACTPDDRCVLTELCDDATNPICDPDLQECLHGLCVSRFQGCDCETEGCPCIGDGGGDGGIGGEWHLRYNCANLDSGQCVDTDGCTTFNLSPGAGPGEWIDDTFTGTLEGDILTWHMRDSDGAPPPYDEVGQWIFTPDRTSFVQQSCYAYEGQDTFDVDTLACSGPTAGHCSGAGARVSPEPPAAIDLCPEGDPDGVCP